MTPIPGITIPVTPLRVVDGDTIVVNSKISDREIKIRLSDCSLAELSTSEGRAAKEWIEKLFAESKDLEVLCHIDWPEDRDGNGTLDTDELIAALFSFQRTLAVLYIEGRSLCEWLSYAGFSTS